VADPGVEHLVGLVQRSHRGSRGAAVEQHDALEELAVGLRLDLQGVEQFDGNRGGLGQRSGLGVGPAGKESHLHAGAAGDGAIGGGDRLPVATARQFGIRESGELDRRTIGFLGIGGRLDVRTEEYSLGQALAAGWRQTAESSTQIFRTVRGLFSGRVAGRELGGPILIGQLAGQATRLGLDALLGFMALISVNLAILNLLPIPVLDGGQFLFLLAEGVLRRPLSLKLRERLTAVGLVLILLLMVFAFSNDIRRVIG
jgi:membrane-associated protease RseP (regulator of RpoE activity)